MTTMRLKEIYIFYPMPLSSDGFKGLSSNKRKRLKRHPVPSEGLLQNWETVCDASTGVVYRAKGFGYERPTWYCHENDMLTIKESKLVVLEYHYRDGLHINTRIRAHMEDKALSKQEIDNVMSGLRAYNDYRIAVRVNPAFRQTAEAVVKSIPMMGVVKSPSQPANGKQPSSTLRQPERKRLPSMSLTRRITGAMAMRKGSPPVPAIPAEGPVEPSTQPDIQPPEEAAKASHDRIIDAARRAVILKRYRRL